MYSQYLICTAIVLNTIAEYSVSLTYAIFALMMTRSHILPSWFSIISLGTEISCSIPSDGMAYGTDLVELDKTLARGLSRETGCGTDVHGRAKALAGWGPIFMGWTRSYWDNQVWTVASGHRD